MPGISVFEYKGRAIHYIDLRQCKSEEIVRIIEEAKKAIAACPHGSVLTLTDVTGASYDAPTMVKMREYVEHNTPYVQKSAVLGITGLIKALYKIIVSVTGREVRIFHDEEAAKEWLVGE